MELMTASEVIKEMGISRTCLAKWIKKGIIIGKRQYPSNHYYFEAQEVEALKAKRIQ